MKRYPALFVFSGILAVLFITSCASQPAHSLPVVSNTVPETMHVPFSIGRLAVMSPQRPNSELSHTYSLLEGAVFQLKELRPALRIVDRANLQLLLNEQRLELSGSVSDETAVQVGRILGVDGVLLYRIEGPTYRDRAFAAFKGYLPPVLVSTKIIMVDSAEVVFHNVVTSSIDDVAEDSFWLLEPSVQAALDRVVAQTITDLKHAFR